VVDSLQAVLVAAMGFGHITLERWLFRSQPTDMEAAEPQTPDRKVRKARRLRVVCGLIGAALAAVGFILFLEGGRTGALAPVIWFVLLMFSCVSLLGALAGRESRRRDKLYLWIVIPIALASIFTWFESHRLGLALYGAQIAMVVVAWIDLSRRREVGWGREVLNDDKFHVFLSLESAIDWAKNKSSALVRRLFGHD